MIASVPLCRRVGASASTEPITRAPVDSGAGSAGAGRGTEIGPSRVVSTRGGGSGSAATARLTGVVVRFTTDGALDGARIASLGAKLAIENAPMPTKATNTAAPVPRVATERQFMVLTSEGHEARSVSLG